MDLPVSLLGLQAPYLNCWNCFCWRRELNTSSGHAVSSTSSSSSRGYCADAWPARPGERRMGVRMNMLNTI